MKILFYRFLAAVMALLQLIFPQLGVSMPTHDAGLARLNENFYTYYYPSEAVHEAKLDTIHELLSRSDNPTSFEGENNGRDGSAIAVSPYFEASVDDIEIPVYSTLVFSGTTSEAELHSYATVFVKELKGFSFNFDLTAHGFRVKKAIILPSSLGVSPKVKAQNINAQFTSYGTYSFMFNNDDQEHAFTLFIKPYVDEEKEIANYKEQLGEENVIVFDAGVHEIEYLDVKNDNSVVYLRAGALLLAKHKFEMTAQENDWEIIEPTAPQNNCVGLARYPVINFYNQKNVSLVGSGTIDMTQLDWLERRGVVFSMCENIEMRGILLTNAPAWTVIAHCCDSVSIEDVTIFGYRTNSDAFAITNTKNATINHCFSRSGDDLFEVKALNTSDEFETKNVTFTNCYGWNGKARCFGVTHEVNVPVSDITFKDCAVIYRDATWDNDIVCSLAVQVGEGGAPVKNILFENIEIYKDLGRPVNVLVMDESITTSVIENVVFRNITWNADMKVQTKALNGNKAEITFENITANSEKINANNTDNWLENSGAEIKFIN